MSVQEALDIMYDFIYDNDKAQVKYTYGEIEEALKFCYILSEKVSLDFALNELPADIYIVQGEIK